MSRMERLRVLAEEWLAPALPGLILVGLLLWLLVKGAS